MKHINPPTLSRPTGYTHVVEVTGGRTLYISGQVAFDREGGLVGKGDFAAQTRQVFENLKLALGSANAKLDDIVKITVFVTDAAHVPTFREIRNAYFPGNVPASTLVQVVQLVRPELMIEIEAVAVVA